MGGEAAAKVKKTRPATKKEELEDDLVAATESLRGKGVAEMGGETDVSHGLRREEGWSSRS
jgi:hypothetical protein